ncbi:Histidine phosphatase superfamily (branch 1) [uncultured archaeon]|nr:Histidine phosphatase superfamily (branch 1) [uncultured archaeon]
MHEGGESYKSMDETRIRPLLKEFQEKYSSRKILVLSHQGTARLIIGDMLGLSPEQKMQVDMPNDCIYYIEYRPHKTEVKYFLCESKKEGNGHLRRPTANSPALGEDKANPRI